ncbi:hypothetical protein E2C01_004059 [Portunus trituberculatus]|uniref:Uncharacterized protein n=1 Tax=Portunus trituberculatus TaxID=210409 RepID=A0A5B7CVB9_PORTR|nr:hypothetical protein [Portunus trituberculatus]
MRQGTVLQENCDVSVSGRPLVVDGREAHAEGLDGHTRGTGPQERKACRALPPKFMFTLLICGKFDTTLGVDQRGSGHGSSLLQRSWLPLPSNSPSPRPPSQPSPRQRWQLRVVFGAIMDATGKPRRNFVPAAVRASEEQEVCSTYCLPRTDSKAREGGGGLRQVASVGVGQSGLICDKLRRPRHANVMGWRSPGAAYTDLGAPLRGGANNQFAYTGRGAARVVVVVVVMVVLVVVVVVMMVVVLVVVMVVMVVMLVVVMVVAVVFLLSLPPRRAEKCALARIVLSGREASRPSVTVTLGMVATNMGTRDPDDEEDGKEDEEEEEALPAREREERKNVRITATMLTSVVTALLFTTN